MATVITYSSTERSRASGTPAKRPGVFRRALIAIMEARQQKADREIAEFLGRRGGVMAQSLGGARIRSRPYAELPAMQRNG